MSLCAARSACLTAPGALASARSTRAAGSPECRRDGAEIVTRACSWTVRSVRTPVVLDGACRRVAGRGQGFGRRADGKSDQQG
jgi:hypothetical protein